MKNRKECTYKGNERKREEEKNQEKSVYCKEKAVSKHCLLTRLKNVKHGQLDSTVILNVNTMSAVLSE